MTREELQAVLENESDNNSKITTILNQVNSEKEQAVKTAVNEEKLNTEQVQLQLKESTGALNQLKKANGDNAELQKTIDDLTAKQEELKAQYNDLKVDSAIKLALTETGAKNVKIAALALDRDLIKLDKDGGLIGLKEQIEKLKSDDSTSFLFEAEQVTEVQPEEPKRQAYAPVKGDEPVKKSQGAELADRILAERQTHQNMVQENIKGTN